MAVEHFGWPGHFCAASRCRFHLHTHVNGYCISTVGDYYPGGSEHAEKPTTIGLDRLFETMVFPLDGDGDPDYSNSVDFEGYNDRKDANRGHFDMVGRYLERK